MHEADDLVVGGVERHATLDVALGLFGRGVAVEHCLQYGLSDGECIGGEGEEAYAHVEGRKPSGEKVLVAPGARADHDVPPAGDELARRARLSGLKGVLSAEDRIRSLEEW